MDAKSPASAEPWNDPDDAPELTDEYFERADIYIGNRLIRRGRDASDVKDLDLDPDLLERLRATGGPAWRSLVNVAIREYLERHAA